MENTIYVKFFGRFTLSRSRWGTPGVAVAQGKSSQRMWTFLQYLCAFHQKGASQEDVIDAVWEDAEIADPVGALKTILHRARTLLEELGFPDGKKVLLYRRGHYHWSPDVTLCLDMEELDRLYASYSAAPEETLPAVLEFLSGCEGDFLPNAAGRFWTLSLRTFYHTRYLQLAQDAARQLLACGRFDEAIGVCRTATTLDPYNEQCQLLLIRLLYISGSPQAALKHYSTVTELYMDQLGMSPSAEMTALYQDISRAEGGTELDLASIRDKLTERGAITGPFFCEYAVFQDVCQLTARTMARSGGDAYLALITITDSASILPEHRRRAEAMNALRASGLSILRPGDVATRLGPSQVLLLLPSADRERASAALDRILTAFYRTPIGRSTRVQTTLLPILPSVDGPQGRKGGEHCEQTDL